MPKRQKTDLLRCTLDLMILKTLALELLHVVAMVDRLSQITGGMFQVQDESLFPALNRLEGDDLIGGVWSVVDWRRIKSYALTPAGRRVAAETKQWGRIVAAVSQVLRAT